jgi:hypothetical protein
MVIRKDSFREMVEKAWNSPCLETNTIERWQVKIPTFRRMVRGWAAKSNSKRLAILA